MPSKEDLKRRASEIIDSKADELVNLAKTILKDPEPGFREVKTSNLVAQQFAALGMQPKSGLAVTGVKAEGVESQEVGFDHVPTIPMHWLHARFRCPSPRRAPRSRRARPDVVSRRVVGA